MRIFGFWKKETGTKRVSMATTIWVSFGFFVMNNASTKFEEHCFNISILYSVLKVSIQPKGFFRFWISSKKVNSDTFCHNIKLWISRFGHAQWSWPCIERLVTNDVTSGTSQSFTFLFCLLDNGIGSPFSISLFSVEENSSPLLKQQLPKLEGFRDSWHDTMIHTETPWPPRYTCGFIAQLVEHRTGIAEVTGSNPVEALICFFRLLLSNCLNWKIYCDDHSSPSFNLLYYAKAT